MSHKYVSPNKLTMMYSTYCSTIPFNNTRCMHFLRQTMMFHLLNIVRAHCRGPYENILESHHAKTCPQMFVIFIPQETFFGMALTVKLQSFVFTNYILQSLSYQEKGACASYASFWYDKNKHLKTCFSVTQLRCIPNVFCVLSAIGNGC